MPLIASNAVVESLWGVIKKRFLWKHPRPSLEFLREILMHHYMLNRRTVIIALRKCTANPPWYDRLRQVWRRCIRTLIVEQHDSPDPEVLFN